MLLSPKCDFGPYSSQSRCSSSLCPSPLPLQPLSLAPLRLTTAGTQQSSDYLHLGKAHAKMAGGPRW